MLLLWLFVGITAVAVALVVAMTLLPNAWQLLDFATPVNNDNNFENNRNIVVVVVLLLLLLLLR